MFEYINDFMATYDSWYVVWEKISGFILTYDAWSFMIENRKMVLYIMALLFAMFFKFLYIETIFSIKKNGKTEKRIRKKYTYFQRVFLIYAKNNINGNVNRFWFDVVYLAYICDWILCFFVIISTLLSHFFAIINIVSAITFLVHALSIGIFFIIFCCSIVASPMGGSEFRSEKKYRRR